MIATETREICVIRGEFKKATAICVECGVEVEHVNLDSAVDLSNIRASEIFRLAREGKIHSVETQSGHLLICGNSLLQARERDL